MAASLTVAEGPDHLIDPGVFESRFDCSLTAPQNTPLNVEMLFVRKLATNACYEHSGVPTAT